MPLKYASSNSGGVTWRFGLPTLLAQFVDRGADLLDFDVGEFDRVHHRLFFYFFRAGLDHDDAHRRCLRP